MDRLLLSGFLIIFGSIACSNKHESRAVEYFEGAILYKGDFIRKTERYDSTTLALMAGQSTTFYTKDGNYLAIIENGITTRLLYRNSDNKVYRQRFNSDTVFWSKCDLPGQKILKMEKKSNVERILGIMCDELKFFYENKTVTYYYNSDTLKSNPDWYQRNTSYNENVYSKEMKSLNLKSIIDYKDFVIIQTAISIKEQKLQEELFDTPKKPLVEDK